VKKLVEELSIAAISRNTMFPGLLPTVFTRWMY
jgi:hypothetical protein